MIGATIFLNWASIIQQILWHVYNPNYTVFSCQLYTWVSYFCLYEEDVPMEATNVVFASKASLSAFLPPQKKTVTSTMSCWPTHPSICRVALYRRPHVGNTCFTSWGSTRAVTKKFQKSHRKQPYFSLICTPAEFELHQRPFILAGKSALVPTKINETLFSPLRRAYSFFQQKKRQCPWCISHGSTYKSIFQKALYPGPTRDISTCPTRRAEWVFPPSFDIQFLQAWFYTCAPKLIKV